MLRFTIPEMNTIVYALNWYAEHECCACCVELVKTIADRISDLGADSEIVPIRRFELGIVGAACDVFVHDVIEHGSPEHLDYKHGVMHLQHGFGAASVSRQLKAVSL